MYTHRRAVGRSGVLIHARHLAQCLAQGKCSVNTGHCHYPVPQSNPPTGSAPPYKWKKLRQAPTGVGRGRPGQGAESSSGLSNVKGHTAYTLGGRALLQASPWGERRLRKRSQEACVPRTRITPQQPPCAMSGWGLGTKAH